MYNLAKLLTEEPEKLERVAILFLRLLTTLFLCSVLFGINISIPDFIHDPIPKNYNAAKIILFFIAIVSMWFLVWSVIGDLLLGELMVLLVSKMLFWTKDKRDAINGVLYFFNVINLERKLVSPGKNVVLFNALLNTYYSDGEKVVKEANTRARQYFITTTILFFTLLFFSNALHQCWIKVIAILAILNFLITSAIFKFVIDYLSDNVEEMKKRFGVLAYTQMLANAIEQTPFLKHHYEMEPPRSRIHLKRKTEMAMYPETFKFYPVYHWNSALTKEMISIGMDQRVRKALHKDEIGRHVDVVVCNVAPDEEDIRKIKLQRGFAFLHCGTEEQMCVNLELLLYQVSNKHYRIH